MNGDGTQGLRAQVERSALGLALFSAFLGTFSGCKKAEPAAEYFCDRAAYIQQSKDFKAGEGRGIRELNTANPIAKGYFGKLYNQDWLSAIERASILDTIDFIESKGARVYRADAISTESAFPMASLPEPPWDLDREWRRSDNGLAAPSCGFIAGLYLGPETRKLPSLRAQAAIIVRRDAGRWTLVHEFMHHNFKTQAALKGYDDDSLQKRRITVLRAIDSLKKNNKVADLDYTRELARLFNELVDVIDELVVQYQFEEVTIEAMLQDQYEKGALRFVSPGSYRNATWYMNYERKLVEDMYAGMNSTFNQLYYMTSTNGLFDEMKKLDRYVKMRDLRLAQLDKVINRNEKANPKAKWSHGFTAQIPDGTPGDGTVPCAHAKQLEGELTEITQTLRSIRAVN